MDEFAIRRRMELGSKAKRALDDEFIQDLFTELEGEIIKQWRETALIAKDVREDCYFSLRAVQYVRTRINALARDGELAAEDLDRLEK